MAFILIVAWLLLRTATTVEHRAAPRVEADQQLTIEFIDLDQEYACSQCHTDGALRTTLIDISRPN